MQLEELESEPHPQNAAEVDDALKKLPDFGSRRKISLPWMAAGAALVVAIVAGWALVNHTTGPSFEIASVRTLAALPGIESDPAVSPDGSTVVFTWNGEKGDQPGLYAIPLSGGSYRRVTSSPTRDYSAAWSPDGRRVAFLRAGRQRRLVLLDVGSSQERILLPDVKIGEQVVFSNKPMLAWTHDSTALVVPMADFDTGKTSLFAVDTKSLSATRLFSTPGREGDSQPAFSPDGQWLAYTTVIGSWSAQLFVRRMGSGLQPAGDAIAVTGPSGRLSGPLWAPSGERLYFGRGSQLMEWSRAGGARTLYNAPSLLGGLSAAWRGDLPRFVLYATPPAYDVRRLVLEQAGLPLAGTSTPFLHSAPAYPFTPSFSTDGRYISYTGKISDDHDEIYMADADGTNHRQLTHDGYRDISFQQWSPDGKQIVFHALLAGPREIYIVDLEAPGGPRVRQLTHSNVVGFGFPSFSLDGKFVYAEDLTHKMVRIPAAGGEPEIWMEGYVPFETKDGRLVYAKSGKRGIFARSLKGEAATNPEEKLVDDYSPPIPPMQIFPDGLYYLSRPAAGFETPRLRFYSFVKRRSVDVAALRMQGGGFTISPDRRRIVYDAPVIDGVDLSVIEMRRVR